MKTTTPHMKTKNTIHTPADLALALIRDNHGWEHITEIGQACEAVRYLTRHSSPDTTAERMLADGKFEELYEPAMALIGDPGPARTLDTHPECSLLLFADGSLADMNKAQSEAWGSAGDFRDKILECRPLTLGERELFGEQETPDAVATEFIVNIRRLYYGPLDKDELASDDRGEPLRFETRAEAEQWVAENEPSRNELYRCAHNEHSRPQYTVIAL